MPGKKQHYFTYQQSTATTTANITKDTPPTVQPATITKHITKTRQAPLLAQLVRKA